ncbi:MAG: DUF3369 domain-containing protein [Desulfobacteraceae bacterium]|nr:MAG: DUF3369 domain-containing protein [Desulfobacteraceae bacterium]
MKEEVENPWKILVADDEEEVHQITKMVLSDYFFDSRGLEFFSAYSGKETKELVKKHPDIAIILLDVVMETENAGLDVVQFIRTTLQNKFIRIILRTGQPGKAPEQNVIMEYDINEYKEKTELTSRKLYTTVTASLRAYKDLITIDKTRRVLELVIQSSEHIFSNNSLENFTAGVLKQMASILNLDKDNFNSKVSGFAALYQNNQFSILAGTGDFKKMVAQDTPTTLPEPIKTHLTLSMERKKGLFIDDAYIGYFRTKTGAQNLIYLNGCKNLTELEKDLIRIFSSNVAIVYDNIYLSQEIVDTQKEIIFTLGELVDTRSKGLVNHVRRVAEFSFQMALLAGIDEQEAELLKLASPMHDVGKIGIPDAILNKPEALTLDEYAVIRSHSGIGHEILKSSKRKILKAATIVAQQHHEHWDGSGYPQGLKGEQIHIYGRITGLADVFDALSHSRVYKKAWARDQVVEKIRNERGKHFDPHLVDLFLENMDCFFAINKEFPE